jgi:hypothetical protein
VIALGMAPESSANASGPRHVVVSAIDPAELAGISLRDTAFATAGGRTPDTRRRVLPYALGGAALASALVIAWISWPHAQAEHASPAPIASTATSPPTASATATEPPAASSTPAIEPTAIATTTASHAAPIVTAHPKASASATSKENHHGDIW